MRRERAVVAAALAAIVVLSWVYTVWLAVTMETGASSTERMVAPGFAPWSIGEFIFTLTMWAVMMVGMMTPSAAPMILIYARVGQQAAKEGKVFASSAWFAAGYLLSWMIFSVFATLSQWTLEQAALLTMMMASASSTFGGLVLIGAGVYQWTPVKEACLRQCQAPLTFIQHQGGFRRDSYGAMSLGLRHGAYCVGCCWALMALLFVGGVMNVLWIAGLMIFVLMEKVIPSGRIISRIAGAGLVLAGIWMVTNLGSGEMPTDQ